MAAIPLADLISAVGIGVIISEKNRVHRSQGGRIEVHAGDPVCFSTGDVVVGC